MSRAFVKEEDPNAPVVLPDRPISAHPNYMTVAGRTEMDRQVARLERDLEELGDSEQIVARTRRAEINRDLRYFRRRLETAEIIIPEHARRVRFGHLVTFLDEDDRVHRFRIVGEDEAEPQSGKVFFLSPLAKALIGKEVGDTARWLRGDQALEIEVTGIE